MASTPIPQNEITRVKRVTFDIKEMAEKVDPTMHDPIVAYEFSNGRQFKEDQDNE